MVRYEKRNVILKGKIEEIREKYGVKEKVVGKIAVLKEQLGSIEEEIRSGEEKLVGYEAEYKKN